jgi:hypothetical protein
MTRKYTDDIPKVPINKNTCLTMRGCAEAGQRQNMPEQ